MSKMRGKKDAGYFMYKKYIKFMAATAILGICVFTLSYIYVLNGTIDDLRQKADTEKLREGRYNEVIVGDLRNGYEQNTVEKDKLYGVDYKVYDLPYYYPYYGQKAYENYSAINNVYSRQYDLEQIAYTDEYGFRIYDGRYIIAIGTYFNAPVGTYIDVELENGVIIPCIVGDIKADCDTEDNNVYSLSCGCATEFIVDGFVIDPYTKGDVSSVFEEWVSPVIHIIVYDYNYFQ